MTLLKIKNLKTYFQLETATIKAVDGIDLEIKKGRTLGLVGESGCGKSLTSLSILRLVPPPGKIVSGEIIFKDKNLLKLSPKQMQKIRGKEISMIFQEPMSSLNPTFTIGYQIEEVLKAHTSLNKAQRKKKIISLLERVHIPSAENRIKNYPHHLSGGMQQRVMIAMAIACQPDLIIADEPTTALDVTIQAEILKLLNELKNDHNMALLFITHNLSIIAQIADEIAVMYRGTIVEKGFVADVYNNPKHPYTKGLLKSIPVLNTNKQTPLPAIAGAVPDNKIELSGCPFHPRCYLTKKKCITEKPILTKINETHLSACHFTELV